MQAHRRYLPTSALGLRSLEAWPPGCESRGVGAQGGPLSTLTPTLPPGLASGREGAEALVPPSPWAQELQHPLACVSLLRVSGLSPDSAVWHGVGSCPAGSPTGPSPRIPRGLPGVHEPLLFCLPRLGPKWKAELGL